MDVWIAWEVDHPRILGSGVDSGMEFWDGFRDWNLGGGWGNHGCRSEKKEE